METRELRYFVAVAEELHFARAAARVGIEQPPLSKAITTLERRLGVQLFVRTRRSTTLTTVGETLLNDARRILTELDRAQCNIRAMASGYTGRLRVSVCDGLAHPRLARLLWRSRRDDPGVDIQIVHSPFSETLRALRVGTVDVGFGLFASYEKELRSVPIWKDPIVMLMHPDHRFAKLENVEHIGPDSGTLILLGERSSVRSEPIDIWLRSTESCGRIEYVTSMELLLTMVAAAYGVGLISAAQAEIVHRPDLTLRPVKAIGAEIRTFLLHRTEGTSSLVARFSEKAIGLAAGLAMEAVTR